MADELEELEALHTVAGSLSDAIVAAALSPELRSSSAAHDTQNSIMEAFDEVTDRLPQLLRKLFESEMDERLPTPIRYAASD